MKRRVVDIQDALARAYTHELPEDHGLVGVGRPCAVSPMFAVGEFGTRGDYSRREPGFPAAMGGPHPDALLPDFGDVGIDEKRCMRRALDAVAGQVSRCAQLEKPPFWAETASPRPPYGGNGLPSVVRWEPVFSKTPLDEEVEHEAALHGEETALARRVDATGIPDAVKLHPRATERRWPSPAVLRRSRRIAILERPNAHRCRALTWQSSRASCD